MKLFYLIFLAFVLSAAGTGVTWGAQWTLSTQAANTQSAITVADGRNVWSVEGGSSLTNTGEIIHYNGSEWSVQTTTFATETGRFRGAYAYDERHVWVVGNTDNGDNDGLVYFYDGGDWCSADADRHRLLVLSVRCLLSGTAKSGWVSAYAGEIYHSSDGGATWSLDTDIATNIWNTVHGTDASHVWAAGGWSGTGRIVFYDGGDWTIQTEVSLGSGNYFRGRLCRRQR